MRKWAFFSAAAAMVAIGCTGSGGSGTGTVTTGTTVSGESRAVVNDAELNTPGTVDVSYITGQGRAPGSPTAIIRRVYFVDEFNDSPFETDFPAETQLQSEVMVGLDKYTINTIPVKVIMPPAASSRLFETFFLEVKSMLVEDANGNPVRKDSANGQPLVLETFAASIRVFRGRYTTVPIFLDDAMLSWDDSPPNPGPVFDRTQFEAVNYDVNENKIIAFLSDYVAFDLSNMAAADRPDMSTAVPATDVYFSGDGQAISTGVGTGPFEVLTPSGFLEGTHRTDTVQGETVHSYTLKQLDPRDLSGIAKITSLLGIWRRDTEVLVDLGVFEFITFPGRADDNLQDLVLVERNGGGQVINMYFGLVDLQAGTFQAWPIRNIDDGSVNNEITGTVSTYLSGSGSPLTATAANFPKVRYGRFNITPSVDVPASFPTTGRFLVFRR